MQEPNYHQIARVIMLPLRRKSRANRKGLKISHLWRARAPNASHNPQSPIQRLKIHIPSSQEKYTTIAI
ncbi:hypothetical protein NC651_002548 [Populus alba x Populus x berolinensis]|nr:hypothetical protein NC651_002548 [Populus alba x Populus x berolinensis]